ncbi:MAG TPA: HAMP domain-containing sensor histidine kinase [Candidatus Dormibacteraeota bacterium]|nr:HAMP domain-containing sensor histidine kinase [Candidatus Dormibacteraeota bacterium]
MAQAFASFPTRLKAVVVGVPIVGVVLAATAAAEGGFTAAQPWRWLLVPVCLAGGVLAERYPVKIGTEQKVNLGALPSLLAVLLLPPGVGPAIAAVSVLAGNRLVRRTWWESAFNAGNVLAAASLAAMAGAIGTDTGAAQEARAAAAAFVYVAVNLLVAVLAAALHSGRPYLELARRAAAASWPASLTLAACAVSIAVLSIEAPVVALLPLIVLPLIYRMNLAIVAQANANEQLAGVLMAQRRFLTDVSHQVATPLATIMTNLSILRRAARSGKSGHAIEDSVAEAERMKRMLGRLRSLAHADEDVPLRRELVDLAELTADVVRAFAAQAGTSGVGLVTEVMAPARINADKDLLREAVANLVDNAVRVSPRGADVRLRVARGAVGPSIDVTDSGPGIEEDRLPRLFERFQRSDSGSGLGLAIARRVVERHGGTIHVQTVRGEGSTFTIELPGG